jgi:short-subunit dehydrogenase
MNPSSMVVLLTGATGGIGQALVDALAGAGARLLLTARSQETLAQVARPLLASGARVATHPADITLPGDRAQLVRWAADSGVNVLINNAGAPCFGEFEALGEALIARVLLTNLVAPMQLTQALLPTLRARREARVLNIGSALGRLGLPGYAVYSASKFGLRGFSESLRRELAGTAVLVQYLGPRTTRTAFNDERVDAYNRAVGSTADAPERVARAALELLQGRAAERFIGFPESLAVRVNGLAPHWIDGALRRHRSALHAAIHTPAAE